MKVVKMIALNYMVTEYIKTPKLKFKDYIWQNNN
jgi:hypothetical protein